MTVSECYAAFHGDYQDAFGRLMKDERILKYLKMFAAGEDFAALGQALDEERYEDAFRAVHNLKGVSLNLGLTPLRDTSEPLCEALRHGKPDFDVTEMYLAVKASYEEIVAAIAQLG